MLSNMDFKRYVCSRNVKTNVNFHLNKVAKNKMFMTPHGELGYLYLTVLRRKKNEGFIFCAFIVSTKHLLIKTDLHLNVSWQYEKYTKYFLQKCFSSLTQLFT